MLSLFQLVYVVPVVIAVVIAGALVTGKVAGAARTLLWSGIALVVVAQFATLLTPVLVQDAGAELGARRGIARSLAMLTTGIVLLIVAVGPSGREPPGLSASAGLSGQARKLARTWTDLYRRSPRKPNPARALRSTRRSGKPRQSH